MFNLCVLVDVSSSKADTGNGVTATRKKFHLASQFSDDSAANDHKKLAASDSISTADQATVGGGTTKKLYSTTKSTNASSPSPADTTPPTKAKTTGPSARKGRFQRDKRMLRQKRRSTGVVSAADLEASKESAEKVTTSI